MKAQYLTSASVVLGDEVRILCDPWLEDGAYHGSWAHYPPLSVGPEDFDDVDFVYISHVHPDHCHEATLRGLDRTIPVLIHDYRWDYLADYLEGLGFEQVIELPNDERTHLKGDYHINVLAADNCDPELCGNFFGCDWYADDETHGSTQVDSMAVVDDGEHVVVDTNDCPYPMAERSLHAIKEQYGGVDALFHQYTGAQFYPQRQLDYSHEQKLAERDRVVEEKLEYATKFVELLEPDYHVPFAGQYFLAGRFAHLNRYTAIPEREDALAYFREHVDQDAHECVFLNEGESIDLATGDRSAPFEPVDVEERRRYIIQELSRREFDYEGGPLPDSTTLQAAIPDAYERLEDKRDAIGYRTETDIYVGMRRDDYVRVSMDGSGYEFVEAPDFDDLEGYVRMELDPRLLERILDGDAHWADAKIGSHIGIAKRPDIYERGLYNCMSAFHQ